MGHLEIDVYPTEAYPDFNEANINDLVLGILWDFKLKTGRPIPLRRAKEIISADSETDDEGKYVVDFNSVGEGGFVSVVEVKSSSVGEAVKQCMLAMKDLGGSSDAGEVYRFVTSGETRQMLSYDGTFQMARQMHVFFGSMQQHEGLWANEHLMLVDSIYAVLSNGGK